MIRHYFNIAFWNMSQQKMVAANNEGAFSITISACLVIALYIRHDFSYSTQSPNGGQVFRIVGRATMNGIEHGGISFPAPVSTALENDCPEIERTGRIMPGSLFGGAGANKIRRAGQRNDRYFPHENPIVKVMYFNDRMRMQGGKAALSNPAKWLRAQ